MQVTTNQNQRLFVIPAGHGGYSCFGFDNCFRDATALAERLGRGDLAPRREEIGTLAQYEQYQSLVRLASGCELGTWFSPDTPVRVREVIESARQKGMRLRLFYGDDVTGRDWMEEFDVVGTIGRSTGAMKVPLIIASERSHGGPAILDDRIVRIIRTSDKRELYRHPQYHLAALAVVRNEHPDYAASVTANGEVHARFKSEKSALNWIAFMRGERMGK
jgi:hypothetical protein